MKFSMHNWMRPEPIETTLDRLHRLGYDGIEINGEPARHDGAEVRRLLDRYELECWGSVTMMTEGRDLVHPDKDVRAGTIAYMKDCVRLIRELSGKIFCIVPSTVGKVKPLASPAEEWRWVVEGLKEVCEFAQENGVTPGVEPLNRFETYLINRHDQALALADEVGFGLGVVLDAFHINIEEANPLGAIAKVGDRLVDFHVADNNRRPAGQGKYDWAEVLDALKGAGYAGHLTAEFVLPVDRTPLAIFKEQRERDMEFTEADLKFIRDTGSGLISAAEYDRAVADNINHLKQYL
ncbi:MAG TPA: sugar phosphate isomerase/epimerase family protein [Blastocatellia bacterium]|jgi:D-psicose/D-tagatose/L-ribulose 3-epimerase|nr:sugar phosphate isomerase/epimerase family protein [Blastocatellia bacterium]